MKKFGFWYLIILLLLTWPYILNAQLENLHGDERYSYSGLHSGNMIRTTFYNDGQVGTRVTSPDDIGGEWPINSGRNYLAKLATFFGAEVKDTEGQIKHIMSESNGSRTGGLEGSESSGDWGPNGEWWTMTPLPGFANDDPPPEKSPVGPRIAMSHWDWSWPATWPDKMDDAKDPGWPGSWNGYFGKNILNADQESYYVMDDYNNREFAFYPDSTNPDRRGLGLRVTVRGFQWSNVLVEDVLFLLYDAKNIGTYSHDKMNYGMMAGPNIGSLEGSGSDSEDDGGAYNLEEELGYQYDDDNIGAGGWTPVGYLGLAYFESPGNPFDGIDNDGDATDGGSGPTITADMFAPKTYNVGDDVILINYKTFERTVTQMKAEGVSITYLEKEHKFMPGEELKEIPNNLIDDNLNGIIDENNGSTFGEGEDAVVRYLYEGLKYVNYYTGEGLDNILIDEKRDDGIDNDGDWDPSFDDVGLDGVPNTGDPGEGDGLPTSGKETNLPGEPHIDKTDIDESDMIGLTAFNIFSPWTIYPLSDDETLWWAIEPGYLNAFDQIGNTDIIVASGYFPLVPEQIERFSVGYIMGYGDELFRNKTYAEKTYLENYNFAKAPNIPTLTAIPGDGRVTLVWDDFAEKSIDPITGEDFQGYRIYRSTDPGFNDMLPITDGYGSVALRKPMVQFDLNDGITDYAPIPVNGVRFWLGEDTGIVHTWVDTTVKNGQKYYYAITSYDRGDGDLGISPSECSKYISITKDGIVDKGSNVAIVRPDAPAAGFIGADFDSSKVKKLPGSTAQGLVNYEIIFPYSIKDQNTYRITFEDTLVTSQDLPATKNFTLVNLTSGDTLLKKSTLFHDDDEISIIDGFKLAFRFNPEMLDVDADNSGWNRGGIYSYNVRPYGYRDEPVELEAGDFRLEIGELGIDTSHVYFRGSTELPAIPVNFKITNTILNRKVKFAFRERDALPGEEGKFTGYTDRSNRDEIIMLSDSLIAGWQISIARTGTDSLNPEPGDVLDLKFTKPFLSHDMFEFTTQAAKVDQELAKSQMDDIKVVPNPYVVANSWEPQNPYSSGRGPRELHFIHLPPKCTIKIFNVRGQLVNILEHDSPIWDGTEIWNMQTKDKLDISYGVYIYHIEAEELGQKTGKFAVIK